MPAYRKRIFFGITTCLLVLAPGLVFAQEQPKIGQPGDIAWMLIATALVAMMTPAGLAMFYGGMTPSRNVINTVGMSYMSYCIGSVVWVAFGYTLAFGPDLNGWGIIGSTKYAFLNGITPKDMYGVIPMLLFVAFQGTFAAIAVALISGSVIERVKFSSWIIFTILWLLLVYSPIAHWIWGEGGILFEGRILYDLPVLDFAGGTVIHVSAGVSGLVFAILIGKRIKTAGENLGPYSIKFTVLGAALLWFGWFGFNGGGALGGNALAANAVLVTNIAASLGVVGWMLIEWLFTGRYTMFGAASGTIAGLVAITPASGYVNASAAMVIGLLGGVIGYFGVYELKKRTNVDDALDAFGVHGLVGIWGSIATGIFADPNVNEAGVGLWFGNPKQVVVQCLAVGVTIVHATVFTVIIYWITHLLTRGVRVDRATEEAGIDSAFHGESA